MAARKHHYVPVFYQKGFANAEGMLCVYDRKLHTYKDLHPIVVCRSEDLYTIRHNDGASDRRIETDILSPIEGAAAPIIRGLEPGTVPNSYDLAILITFISLQFTRLPSFGKAVSTILETTMNQYLQMRLATPERVESAMRELESETNASHVDAASMVEAITKNRIRIKATERGFLQYMFEQANTLGDWLQACDWTILVAPQSTGFIVCDHPFVSVPPQGAVLDGMSFGVPGSLSYFPLTRHYCLQLRAGDYGFRYTSVDSRTVRTVNHNIAANSDRFVMASNQVQLEAVINRSTSTDVESIERFSIDVITNNQDHSFIKFTFHPRRYFY